jgi:hypothetical protein
MRNFVDAKSFFTARIRLPAIAAATKGSKNPNTARLFDFFITKGRIAWASGLAKGKTDECLMGHPLAFLI